MDIDVYRNFLTVVSCGTISEAARQLNMTQPALSMQMKMLQNSLGEVLLNKGQGTHKMELTPAGELVYQRAEEMIRLEDELQAELSESLEGLNGTLQLGVLTWGDQFIVGEVIPAFHKLYPKVRFSIRRLVTSTMKCSANECDVRVILRQELPAYEECFDILQEMEVGLFVVVHKDNPWFGAEVKSLTTNMLNKVSLGVFDTNMGKFVLNHMYSKGLEPDILLKSTYRRGLLKAANSGMVATLLFSDTDKVDYPELRYIPLLDDYLKYVSVVGKPKGMKLSPLLQRFNEFVKSYWNKRIKR